MSILAFKSLWDVFVVVADTIYNIVIQYMYTHDITSFSFIRFDSGLLRN